MAKVNKKILIVEDDEDFVFILEKKFTTEGLIVVTAKNGQEGIAAVQKEKPGLIFSDMLMPQMDGMEMAAKIREFNQEVPIMFLTNLKEGDRPAAKGIANIDYIIKSETPIADIVQKAKDVLKIK